MNTRKYHIQLGATEDCTKITVEATKGLGLRDIKGATKDCYIFKFWFSAKRLAESAMDAGVEIISMV